MANFISPPENLTGNNSNGAVNLSWSCQTSGVVFKVYRALQSDFSDQQVVISQYPLTFVDVTCQSGTTYYYRVCSILNSAISDYSNYVAVTPTTFPPPSNFRVVELKPGRVKLAWERSLGTIYHYWVFRGQNNCQQWANSSGDNGDTTYTDSTAVCGQTYYYKIRAQSNVMSGIMDQPIYATIPFKKNVYSDFVFLPDADSNGYPEVAYLYKKGDDSAIVSIMDLGNNRVLQTFGFGNYHPNTLLQTQIGGQIKLIAALDSLDSVKTIIKILDVGLNSQTLVLNQPVNFQAGTAAYDRVSLSWQGNNPDSLGVQYCLYANQTNDSSTAQFIGSTTGTNYTQAGLSPGGSWYYWLRATVGLEVSPLVGSVSASTNSLAAPTNLAVRQVTGLKVVLGWTPVVGVQNYAIYRNGSNIGYAYADSFVDMSVSSPAQYSYQVASAVGNYYSSPTDALAVSTPFPYIAANTALKNIVDMEFLPSLDGDSLPEVAVLGMDTLLNRPVVYVRGMDENKVIASIPFLDTGVTPISFFPTIDLNGDGRPELTVLGQKDSVSKIETRYFSGDTLIR
jgi:hypothetical protein